MEEGGRWRRPKSRTKRAAIKGPHGDGIYQMLPTLKYAQNPQKTAGVIITLRKAFLWKRLAVGKPDDAEINSIPFSDFNLQLRLGFFFF